MGVRDTLKEIREAFKIMLGPEEDERELNAEVAKINKELEENHRNAQSKPEYTDQLKGYSRSRVMKATGGKPTRKREEEKEEEKEQR